MKSVKALESDKARLQEALNLVMPEMRGMASISSTASDIVGKVDSLTAELGVK